MDYKSRMTFYVGLLGIIGCLLLSTTSYALWTMSHTQSTTNALASGCFSTTFTDDSPIKLEKAYPISETAGLKLSPYTFTITNTCTNAA